MRKISVLQYFFSEDISLEENLKLKASLADEEDAHESVKLLLRKYERCRVTDSNCCQTH